MEQALATDRVLRIEGHDEELALAARSDPQAFGLLYRRHRLSVFRYLRARTANDEEAAELTSVTFERAFRGISRYRTSGAGVVAWLLRIARNAAIDAGRRSGPSIAVSVEPSPVRTEPSPEDSVLAREEREVLLAAVRGLPEPQRDAVVLRYAAGLTARQIGAVIGKSEAATQKLLSRALLSIRESYDARR